MLALGTLDIIRNQTDLYSEIASIQLAQEQFVLATNALCNVHRMVAILQQHPEEQTTFKRVVSDYNEIVKQFNLDNLLVSTEGVVTDIAKAMWENLVKFITWIWNLIYDFFQRLFSRREWYVRHLSELNAHFKKYQIKTDMFEQYRVSNVLPYAKLQPWLEQLNSISFDLVPLMALFSSTGELSDMALEQKGLKAHFTSSDLFAYSVDDLYKNAIITVKQVSIDNALSQGKMLDLGWSGFAVQQTIAQAMLLMEGITRYETNIKQLKKTLLDGIQQHVQDENTHARYKQGIQALQQIVVGYSTLSMLITQHILVVASVAKRFCS